MALEIINFVLGAFLAVAFAYIAFKFFVVDEAGAIATALFTFLIVAFTSLLWFIPVLVGTVLTAFSTRFKYGKKLNRGVAESAQGRGWLNIVANGVVPVSSAVLYGVTGSPIFLLSYIGSVAAATADTTSAEIGPLSRDRPRLITTFKKVKVGTDGAVSLIGTVAGVVAAFLVSIIPFAFGLFGFEIVVIGTLSGIFGNVMDSVVGATLERKGLFDKHMTNLACCLSGSASAFYLFLF